MTTDQPLYCSYLLRLCHTTSSGMPRVTLLNVHDPADHHHFLSIDDLYLFLHRRQSFTSPEQDQGPSAL